MARPQAQTLRDQLVAENPSDAVAETPSQKLIRENQKSRTKTLTDELGRTIIYRGLGPLEQMKLYGALGEMSSNEQYSRYAQIAISVQSIDGNSGPPSTSRSFIEARVDWIGEEGFNAIWAMLIENAKSFMENRSPEEIAEEHRTSLKKSSTDQDC